MLEERILPAIDSQAIPLTWTAANVIHVSDFIESRSDVDLFALNLAQGDVVQLDIDASTIGSGLDSYLRVFNSAGLQIAANDNFDATDSRLTFQAGSAGTYYFGVSSAGNDQYDPAAVPGPVPADLGPDRGFYNLTITRTANGAVTAAAPDLVGGSFEVVPNIAVAGDTITVRYRVENRGGAAVTGPFTVEFRLSTDNTFDGTDTAVVVLSTTLSPAQGSIVASGVEYLGGLAGGASFSDEITFTLPAIGSAPIFIGMRIDSAGQVSESNEANNNSTVRGSDWDALNVLNPTAVGPADSTSTFVLQSPAGSLAADFDGDGILDLAYLNSTTASNPIAGKFFTLAILRGAGDGTFALTGNLLPDSLPSITLSSMTSADFNGDGRADLVIAGPTQVYVFLANGAGGFSDPLAVANPLGLALDFGATGIVTGDFNADGRMDLAIAPATGFAVSGQLLVYLGQGDGAFTAQPGLTVTGTLDGPLVTGD
ncbi:MAG: FG-GAP-like repeat-containing protein, partial [Gemmataceae bacterium]